MSVIASRAIRPARRFFMGPYRLLHLAENQDYDDNQPAGCSQGAQGMSISVQERQISKYAFRRQL
jgi:hypothetical protein